MIKKIFKWGLIVVGILFILAIISSIHSKHQNSPANSAPPNTSGASETAAAAGTSTITPSCFTAYKTNPILTHGSLLPGANWNDPSVIKVGSQYVMYASASADFSGTDIQIYRLVSSDGIKWTLSPNTPVLSPSTDSSAWDSKGTETPAVVLFNGTYYLFYLGYNTSTYDAYAYKVGYATSRDGITFTRAGGPILAPVGPQKGSPTGNFMQYIVSEPGPVVYKNKIYLYFTAEGADTGVGNTLQTIGLVTSSDGTNWSAPIQVFKPDQTLYPRSAGWIGYSTPSAVVVNGKVYVFYDVANENPSWKQEKIGYAASSNGVSNWVQSPPIFQRSDFAWTSSEIQSPTEVLDGSTLKMWFSGHDSTPTLGIGLANCTL